MKDVIDEDLLIRRGWTTSEWEAHLRTLQSNPVVRRLLLRVTGDPALMKSRGELWGRFLENSQTLRTLSISFDPSASPSSNSAYMSELVSGLRRNPHPAVESLVIRHLSESSVAVYVSEIIRCMKKLQRLSLFGFEWKRLSEDIDATGVLASSIAEAVQLNLLFLSLHDWVTGVACKRGVSELFRKIFPAETDPGRRFLPELNIRTHTEEIWESFPFLAGSNISSITLDGPPVTLDSYPRDWLRACADALKSSPLISIEIGLHRGEIQVRAHRDCTGTLTIRKFASDSSPYASPLYEEQLMEFFQQLFAGSSDLSSSLITELVFLFWGASKRWGKSVFESLESSRSITSLSLTGCNLKDGDFEHLMRLLRVNFTIREVKLERTSWRNDGKAALIEEALVRNNKLTREFSILKGAGFEFDKAKVGRIFMCGSPYAGKTQLKLCMMKLHHKRSQSVSKPGKFSESVLRRLKMLELRRTRGAEVEVLTNDKEGQVSLWDLAGQYIFRALHDLIFPRTNQSLIFIFAFNPFRSPSKDMKENVHDVFTFELEDWLKFIASNCQTSGANERLPQVLVVITHRDCTEKSGSNSFECGPGSSVLKIVKKFQTIFQGVVELVSNIYHVDAYSRKDVKPFLKDILALMNNWSKSHAVPVVFSDISSALITHVESSNGASPVWSLFIFFEFCRKNHESLKYASPEVLFTIASYLHDVGRIIIVPECSGSKNEGPLVIIDPNWCTENFLGALISEGNHFDVHGGSSSGSAVLGSSDGFISEADFQSLLQKIIYQMNHPGIETSLLEDLLQRLDLCYRFEDNASARYFVPVICGGLGERHDLKNRKLQWDDGQTEGSEYLGYRLHCEDTSRTSFNKAFFSRFQINFRQKLMQRFGIKESNGGIGCGLGLLRVMYDGYVVFVESDEVNGQHVDIMVKSSQPGVKIPRTRMQIIRFVKEHFLQELQAFCASPSGCPGLRLIVSVIRTSSVQNLVPIHERRAPKHIVRLEELKGQFRFSIDLTMEGMAADLSEESLLNFQYTWPDGGHEFAKNALGEEDVIDILMYAREKLRRSEGEVESCTNDLQRMLTILQGEMTTVDGRSSFMGRNADPSNSTVTVKEEAETSRRVASYSPAAASDNIQLSAESKHLVDVIRTKVEEVGRKIDHLTELTHCVYTELQEVKNLLHKFRTGLMEMQRVMTEVNSSIDKLIGYSISREEHSSPRRPYFSQNDFDFSDFLPRAKAYVLQGQAVRLHFLCEARNQPHVVPDQSGLPLVVTPTNMSWVPIISKISVKLISTLISVGLPFIPNVKIELEDLNFVNLNTGKRLPLSDKLLECLKEEGTKITVNPEDPDVVQAWSSLQKFLGEKLNYREYRNTFGLCRVRYRYGNDPYAWICESCLEKGTKQRILYECIN